LADNKLSGCRPVVVTFEGQFGDFTPDSHGKMCDVVSLFCGFRSQ
jgi:hypothetical protein